MRHHRAGTNKGSTTQSNTAEDGGIRPDRDPLLDPGLFRPVTGFAAPWEAVVCQRNIWTDEDVIGHVDMLPDRDPVLDCHVVAKCGVGFDEHVVSDVTIAPDSHIRHDMRKGPDTCALPNAISLDECLLMHENQS